MRFGYCALLAAVVLGPIVDSWRPMAHPCSLHRLKAVASGYGLKPDPSAVRRTHVTLKLSLGSGGAWFSVRRESLTGSAGSTEADARDRD
jgi:hypothetical protein